MIYRLGKIQEVSWLACLCWPVWMTAFMMLSQTTFAQNDSLDPKPSAFQALEAEKLQGKTNFEHWTYSKKTHAVVGYLGSIAQGGFSDGQSPATWHYDLGAIYQGKWLKYKNYRLNFHAWVEHTNLVLGQNPKQFAKDLKMFSVPNASDAENSGISLEYLHFENFFFDGFWDVTVGKLEPLFYITFANYSGWDKLTLFSKTASSDPVPDMDGAFGVFTEFNITDNFSVGGQILDDKPRNEYFDPGNFFGNTTYNFQSFVRWSIPTKNKYYSYHVFNVYTYPQSGDRASGNGWLYVGNQGISKRLIFILKLSNGSGRVLKYNGAYTAGFVYLNPFNFKGDQVGASLAVNELNNQYEYGIDSFYKWFFKDWLTASVNVQCYYTQTENIAVIPGVRIMMTY